VTIQPGLAGQRRAQDGQDQEAGQYQQQVDDPHHGHVDVLAEVAGQRAGDGRDAGGHQGGHQPDHQRFLQALESPGVHIATDLVHAHEVAAVRPGQDVALVEVVELPVRQVQQEDQHQYQQRHEPGLLAQEPPQDQPAAGDRLAGVHPLVGGVGVLHRGRSDLEDLLG
jgi:hypothetical protein